MAFVKSVVLASNLIAEPPVGSTPGRITPFTLPFTIPANGIGVFRVITRLHFTSLAFDNFYGATWNVLRTSDNSLLGGVVVSRGLLPDPTPVALTGLIPPVPEAQSASRVPETQQADFDMRPDLFYLGPSDSLFGLLRVYFVDDNEWTKAYSMRLFAFMFYFDLNNDGNPIPAPAKPI